MKNRMWDIPVLSMLRRFFEVVNPAYSHRRGSINSADLTALTPGREPSSAAEQRPSRVLLLESRALEAYTGHRGGEDPNRR